VRFTAFDDPFGSSPFGSLEIVTERSARDRPARLRVEAGSPRLIRCAIDGDARLWARPDRHLQGIWVLRGACDESPNVLPPWRFDEARAIAEASRRDGGAAWAKQMARALFDTPEPGLDRGTYRFARPPTNRAEWGGPCRGSPGSVLRAFEAAEPEWLPWQSAFGVAHPLRARPRAGDARVKAWRKAAREGWLPPLLLAWISGLNAYVLLDGHGRLRAAELEETVPDVLVVWRLVEVPNESASWADDIGERYARASRGFDAWTRDTAASLNRELARAFSPTHSLARSLAVARADLRGVFVAEVEARLRQLGRPPGHAMLDGIHSVTPAGR